MENKVTSFYSEILVLEYNCYIIAYNDLTLFGIPAPLLCVESKYKTIKGISTGPNIKMNNCGITILTFINEQWLYLTQNQDMMQYLEEEM